MSFLKNLKAIFTGSQETRSKPQNESLQEIDLPDSTKVFVFNTFGSEYYDYFLRLGNESPGTAKFIFSGLECIEKANTKLIDFANDPNSLIVYCVRQSLVSLNENLEFHKLMSIRFYINSVEFQARVDYATDVISSAGITNKDVMQEWIKQEQINQSSASNGATFFNAPLSLFLAQDEAFTAIDNSPRTKIILWGTLSTANLFAANALVSIKQLFALPSPETEEAMYGHFRAAWIAYVYNYLKEDNSASGRAIKNYFQELIGDVRLLETYGMHMMEVFRRNLYDVGTSSDRYAHFSGIILPIFPDISILSEELAKEFFDSSRILAFIASQTQWLSKRASADLNEQHAMGLNQNLYSQSIEMMRDKSRPEFQGFLG